MLTLDNIGYADIVIRRFTNSLKVKRDGKLRSSVYPSYICPLFMNKLLPNDPELRYTSDTIKNNSTSSQLHHMRSTRYSSL
jgi:hypothetical protein